MRGRAGLVAGLLLLAALLFSSSAGCTASHERQAVEAASTALDVAHEALGRWDLEHQKWLVDHSISLAQYDKRVAEYRAARSDVVESMRAAYVAVEMAASAPTGENIGRMLDRLKAFYTAVKTLKVEGE